MTAPPKSFDQSALEFHVHVGYCIAAWSGVDSGLFNIFRQCVGPIEQSAIIYYRTSGLDARFKLTEELVVSLLPRREQKSGSHNHPDVVAWGKAIARHGDLLGVRRRIAHLPVDVTFDSLSGQGLINRAPASESAIDPADLRTSFQIYASRNERFRTKEAKTEPLMLQDLIEHFAAVNELAARLHGFFYKTMANYAPTFPVRAPPPPIQKYPTEDVSTIPRPPRQPSQA